MRTALFILALSLTTLITGFALTRAAERTPARYGGQAVSAASRPGIPPAYIEPIRRFRTAADELERNLTGADGAVAGALDAVNAINLSELSDAARIVVQNTALHVAILLDRADSVVNERLVRRARRLAQRVALPSSTLAELSAEPLAAAEPWLGDSASWIERTTSFCGDNALFHERKLLAPLAFHPLRAGDRRALISNLIAFDTEGNPHLTPIIQSIEMRLGMEVDSPVAILELDLDSLGNGEVGVTAPAYAKVHESMFVQKDGQGGFLCAQQCHRSIEAWDAADVLDRAEAAALIARRTSHSLELAARRAAGVGYGNSGLARIVEWIAEVP